jgi:PAS domain S-box-containing protein
VFPNLEKQGLRQPFFAEWEKIVSGFQGKLSTEYAYVREIKLDSHWYLQQFSFIPIGPKIRVYAVNIDEKKKIEEALKESEQKFRSLFENMINGYAYCKMLFDEQGEPEDYVYLELNGAFETITGLKREATLGRKATQVIPGIKQSNPELFEIYGRVAKTQKPERFEVFFKPLNIWLDISVYGPKKDHFVSIYENISERKRLEQELNSYNQRLEEVVARRTAEYTQTNKRLTKEIMDRKKSEEGLLLRAMILDNLNQAIVLTNQKGEFVYSNHAACTLFGYSCEEFLAMNFMELLQLEEAEQKKLLDKLLKTKEAELKTVTNKKDKTRLPVLVCLSMVKTVHGEFIVSVLDRA